MESQGKPTIYIYWILSGEVTLHRRILGLYPENKLTSADLNLFSKPSNPTLGNLIGRFTAGDTLVCEDSCLTHQELRYSVVAGNDLLVWRYEASEAIKEWPIDVKQKLR